MSWKSFNEGVFKTDYDEIPETKLAKAVLVRAFMDSVDCLNPSSSCGPSELKIVTSAAKNFLTTPTKIFHFWCAAAGAEPDYIKFLYYRLEKFYLARGLKGINIKVLVERAINRIHGI
jgi:hypothetical protein